MHFGRTWRNNTPRCGLGLDLEAVIRCEIAQRSLGKSCFTMTRAISGGSRTGQNHLCVACLICFTPALTCPECGSRIAVCDLRKPAGRKRAIRHVWHHDVGMARRALYSAMVLSPLVLASATLVRSSSMGDPEMVIWLALLLVSTRLAFYGRAAQEARPPLREREILPLRNLALPLVSSDDRVVVRGRARAREKLTAPVSGEACIAFRLRSSGITGNLDNAAAVAFEVEGDPAGRVRVAPGDGTIVDIPVGPETAASPGKACTLFLEQHGAFASLSPQTVAEGLLRDGDEVIVEGRLGAPDRDGKSYRDTTEVRVIEHTAEDPLAIRAISRVNDEGY